MSCRHSRSARVRTPDLMTVALLTWCYRLAHSSAASSMAADNDADLYLTSPQLIAKHGYPVQTHSVQTADGYILELHRIPHGKSGPANSTRPAVLMHHALLCSSFDWVGLGPERSLGFILADAGYDVWLANARGNTYSRKHVSLDPSEPRFWEYSWHEMGTYDIPAEIDYILQSTGHSKLYYIGHSMGTTMFFVMTSQRPEYNQKIHAMIALAPVAVFTRTENPVIHFVQTVTEHFLEERLPVLLAHTPAGASTREVMHFAQGALSGEFRQFDFGEKKNMDEYGQATPPKYNLSLVTSPVALYYSDNDRLAPVKNVNKTCSSLPNVVHRFRVPFRMFNHLDFIWGKDADTLVYSDVITVMKKHENDARTAQELT